MSHGSVLHSGLFVLFKVGCFHFAQSRVSSFYVCVPIVRLNTHQPVSGASLAHSLALSVSVPVCLFVFSHPLPPPLLSLSLRCLCMSVCHGLLVCLFVCMSLGKANTVLHLAQPRDDASVQRTAYAVCAFKNPRQIGHMVCTKPMVIAPSHNLFIGARVPLIQLQSLF